MFFARVLFLILSFYLFACGQSNERDSKKIQDDQKIELNPGTSKNYESIFNKYSLFESNCDTKNSKELMSNIPIKYWTGESFVEEKTDININLFEKIEYGEYTQFQFRCEPNCSPTPSEVIKIKDSQLLKFCQKSPNYPPNSIEYIALNVSYHIQNALTFYYKIEREKPLPRLTLKILPAFERVTLTPTAPNLTTKKSDFIINNASWQLSNNRYSINMFPQTENVNFYNGSEDIHLFLWEIPLVAAHEFGHHIFYQHAPNLLSIHNLSHINNSLINNSNTVDYLLKEKIAVSEAIADLFAHYSLKEQATYKNILCMEKNRDLTSHSFANTSTLKILSKKNIDIFAKRIPAPIPFSCNEPNFTNFYDVAATLAYGTNLILSSHGNLNAEQKAQIMIRVINTLNAENQTLSGDQSYIQLYIDAISKVALEYKIDKSFICEQINKIFPFYLQTTQFCSVY